MTLGIKIRNKLYAYNHKLNVLKYRLYSNKSGKIGIEKGAKRKIIVSLTTYPKRFNVVHITLESLLSQTLKPNKIILYISEQELNKNKIPEHIKKFENRGVTIIMVKENLRSYKKLIYALEKYPNYNIVTVDDDILYPKHFLKNLYTRHIDYPDEIIAYRCSWMRKKSKSELMPYLSWKNAFDVSEPSFNLFFTGVGGVLYPPNSLHKEVLNKNVFLKLAPTADDVWFKAMSLLADTKTVQVHEKYTEFPIINEQSQEVALWKTNNELNHNDMQLKKVFDYYNLYRHIKEENA